MTDARSRGAAAAITVGVLYALFAGLWILLSDAAIGLLFSDSRALLHASLAKGWLFVAVTSLLLYWLVRRLAGALAAVHARELAHERERRQPPPMLVAMVEASDNAIVIKDEAGRYLLVNPVAARLLGKPAEQVIGQTDRALFPPEQADRIMAVDSRVRLTGQAETAEEPMTTADGERILLVTRGPLRGTAGQVFGTYEFTRDFTDARHAQRDLQRKADELSATLTARHVAEAELRQRNQELERFNRAAVERELRMVALKREVNALARAAGRPAPYDIAFADAPSPPPAP